VRAKEVYVLGAIVKEGGVVPGLEALLLEAERVDRHGFVATELDRAQRDLLRQYEQAYAERDKTNSASYAGEYGRHVLENEPIPGIAKEYELVQAYLPTITLEEVNRLAAEWITDTNRVVMVSAPDKPDVPVPGESALAQVLARTATLAVEPYQDVVRDEPLIPNPPAGSSVVEETAIESVDVTTWRLGNGVRVLLKPTDFKDDEILMQAWSPGGTSLAPDSIYVPAMTAASAVSVSGVGEFSLIELQKALADKAVQVGPYVSPLYEGFSGRASPKDLETLLQLVYLYATAPRADPAGFEAYRGRMRAMLVNRDASPEVAFQDSLNLTLAQHHPRRPTYSVALLDRMDLARSVAFYRERFADASDLTFVFVGSFTLDGIRPLVERYLGGLPANGRRETWRDEGIVPPAGVVQKTVRKGLEAKSRTTIVYTGSFDDTRDERYALRSLSDVLDIRLRERLREDLGGTYDVGVSATSQRVPREEYSFTISFGSAPERAEELTRGVFDVIDSIATLGPTATDIEKVREIQRRERETSLRENGYWLGRIVTYDRNDTDLGEILTGERLIEGLGPSIVRDAAARYLRRDRYVQVRLMPEGAP
jgi:zinc protease